MISNVRNVIGVGVLVVFCQGPALAVDTKYPQDEYAKHITSAQSVATLGPDLFGEQVNLYTGATEFRNTDVLLSGIGPAVSVGRRFEVKDRGNVPVSGSFADWDLDIPHLHGVFAKASGSGVGWLASTAVPSNRCSSPTSAWDGVPPTVPGNQGGQFDASEYWAGNHLYVPGQGSQPLLLTTTANPILPTAGGPYRWVTGNQWYVSCLPSSANNVPGEAFLAIDPTGTRYWFNWIVKREAPILKKAYGQGTLGLQNKNSKTKSAPPVPQVIQDNWILARQEVWILPTRIEDRFGNAVTYTYNPGKPWQLTSIDGSDGRTLTLTYANDVVTSVTDGQRTWQYTYAGRLTGLINPDGSKWVFNLETIRSASIQYSAPAGASSIRRCDNPGVFTPMTKSGSMTHPSGAVGDFEFQPVRMGRSYVPKALCWAPGPNGTYVAREVLRPVVFDNFALTRKQLSGPGISTASWNYAWGPANFSYAEECSTNQCPSTRALTINGPEGGWTRYSHSNRYFNGEGKLVSTEQGAIDSGSPLFVTQMSYLLSPSGQAYPAQIGIDLDELSDRSSEQHQPMTLRKETLQGRTFMWQVAAGCASGYCFDALARPTKIIKSSSP